MAINNLTYIRMVVLYSRMYVDSIIMLSKGGSI